MHDTSACGQFCEDDILLTSPILISASVYCSPFIIMLRSAAGGTKAPLMFDWLIWLSIPNVYAECTKPTTSTEIWNEFRLESCKWSNC